MLFKCQQCNELLNEPRIRISEIRWKKHGKRKGRTQRPHSFRTARILHSYGDKFEIKCPKCGFVGMYEKIGGGKK